MEGVVMADKEVGDDISVGRMNEEAGKGDFWN